MNLKLKRVISPNHKSWFIAPDHAASASIKTRRIEVGIGVPSKYFTLPVPWESVSAVTLYRARRETPQATKKARAMRSYRPCMPQPYPMIAGATPKEIISESESSSRPSIEASSAIWRCGRLRRRILVQLRRDSTINRYA